jgi:NTE family protein
MPSESAIFEALRISELTAGLDEAELLRLARIARVAEFSPGERMLTAGQLNDRLYVLASGIAEVFSGSEPNGEQPTRCYAGACLGEMSALSGKPITLSVRAQSPVRALAFDGEPLREELTRVPRLGANLAQVLIERLRGHIGQRSARLVLVALPDAREEWRRVAQTISQAVFRHAPRTVVIDLLDESSNAPSVAALATESARMEAFERELAANGADLLTVKRGTSRPPLPQLSAVLNLLGSQCEVLVVIAEEREAFSMATEKPEIFVRYVSMLAGRASPVPRLPQVASGAAPECRVVWCDESAPKRAGAMRTADAQFGARVYSAKRESISVRDLAALARDLAGARIGLALGAGSSRGFAHIGVLERLAETGVPIDALVGSSVGAGVGSLWSFGYEPDRIEALFAELRRHGARWNWPIRSLLNGARLERHLRHSAAEHGFDDTLWPFGVVAVDLYAGRETMFTSGDLPQCVLASCAVPGIYPPVRMSGRLYVDGGVLHPIPSGFVRPLGVEKVIAVDLAGAETPEDPPRSGPFLLEIMRRCTNLMHTRISEHSRAAADIVVWPQSPTKALPGVLDYRKARNHWRTLGREAVDKAADQLRSLLPAR